MKRIILCLLMMLITIFITSCDGVLKQDENAPVLVDVSIERIDEKDNKDLSFSPNEEFYIIIELNNEQDLVIDSIEINEYRFKNVYFEEDSTNSIIKIKYSAPSASGNYKVILKGLYYKSDGEIKNIIIQNKNEVEYTVTN